MFIATVIHALPHVSQRLTIADAAFAHAAILRAVTQADATVGRVLHEASRHKTFSCALLPGASSAVRIRLVLHTETSPSIAQTLLTTLNQSPTLRLGRAICAIQSVEITPSAWSGVASWADLLDDSTSHHITMRFVTPTAIMKTNGLGQRYTSLLPDPVDIFLGLQRRWHALGGPALRRDLAAILNDAGCIIARHQVQTTVFQAPERLQIGFCGSVTYQLRNTNPEFVQALCALARLAHFTGIGYQTTRGMGLIQTTIG